MAFELGTVRVRELRLGVRTALERGLLHVDAEGLRDHLLQADARLGSVRIHVARPGDATRVACVKDAIEPRVKLRGHALGEGRVHVLGDVAVVTCGQIVGFQEGLIDMSGPGARHSPFSALQLLVLEIDPAQGLTPHEHEAALREAGLRAAERVGRIARDATPDN